MLWKCETSIWLPLFHLCLRLGGLWDTDLPRPLHRHLDALLRQKTESLIWIIVSKSTVPCSELAGRSGRCSCGRLPSSRPSSPPKARPSTPDIVPSIEFSETKMNQRQFEHDLNFIGPDKLQNGKGFPVRNIAERVGYEKGISEAQVRFKPSH